MLTLIDKAYEFTAKMTGKPAIWNDSGYTGTSGQFHLWPSGHNRVRIDSGLARPVENARAVEIKCTGHLIHDAEYIAEIACKYFLGDKR